VQNAKVSGPHVAPHKPNVIGAQARPTRHLPAKFIPHGMHGLKINASISTKG
jgi:hypothetical protein